MTLLRAVALSTFLIAALIAGGVSIGTDQALALDQAPAEDTSRADAMPVSMDSSPGEKAARGAYLFSAAGCANCHTDRRNDGPPLGGGVALKSPFGTFYGPNITPHPVQGIGSWSDRDFLRAMRDGVSPEGRHYYPSFPYAAYSRMRDEDILAIKAYIDTLPPSDHPNRAHELRFPFNIRAGLVVWKWLYFEPGAMEPDLTRSESWNRGAYLVEALAHCAECHTPRTRLGGLDRAFWMAGTASGPDGGRVPNITPDQATGIGDWSDFDILDSLQTGALPDGDFVGGSMADVVRFGTSQLTDEDRQAILTYLRSLTPIHHPAARSR